MQRTSVKQAIALRDMLSKTPMTYEQLVAATGMSQPRVAYWRKSNADNIYVAAWAPDKRGRLFNPVWAWGDGEDAPRPGRSQTSAERMRELRARRKLEAQAAPAAEPPVVKETTRGIGLDDLI